MGRNKGLSVYLSVCLSVSDCLSVCLHRIITLIKTRVTHFGSPFFLRVKTVNMIYF